jgi:hypothetical protein
LDSIGNKNNFLMPDEISKNAGTAAIAPSAENKTVQGLAGQVPKESDNHVPGEFPTETPQGEVSVAPIPSTGGVGGNPIQLKPGEPVPAAAGKIDAGATYDKASYDQGAAAAPLLPRVVTPDHERGEGLFGLPEQSKNMIPESSLPVAGGAATANINSAGANATTAQLAGQVPHEPRGVPEVVKDSQAEAHSAPEASANPEAVREKGAVEDELEKKVPEAPAASESTIGGKAAATIGAAAAGVGAAAAGAAAYVSSGKAKEDATAKMPAKEDVKGKLPESAHPAVDTVADKVGANGAAKPSSNVPNVVQESIKDAHTSPEAAANTEAVAEKKQVESELAKSVPVEESAGAPAPTATETTTEPKAMMKSTEAPLPTETTKSTEEPVRDTTRSTESADIKPGTAMAAALGEPKKEPSDSRDVSPMTRPDGTHADQHIKPEATGLKKAAAAMKSGTGPNVTSPLSAKSTDSKDDKKDKRGSGFFRKLKERFEHHDKKEKK